MRFNLSSDAVAYAALTIAVLLLASLVPSPFLRWTVAGSAVIAAQAFRKPTERQELISIAVALPLFVLLIGPFSFLVMRLTPHPMDAALLNIDYNVGTSLYRWMTTHPPAREVVKPLYNCLPILPGIVLAFSLERKRLVFALIFAAVLALPCYLGFPAVGPAHIGEATAPRNCIPSLHLAWALLLFWYSPRFLRIPTFLFVLITCATTPLSGEHYVIDLIVAVPFSAAVIYATNCCVTQVQDAPPDAAAIIAAVAEPHQKVPGIYPAATSQSLLEVPRSVLAETAPR